MTAPHMQMMNGDGLLECAHCGELDGVMTGERLIGDSVYSHVMCASCGIETGARLYMSNAVKAWNTRNGYLYTAQDFKDAAWERQNSDLIK